MKKQLFDNAIQVNGIMDSAVRFVIDNQLKDRETWRLYIDVFLSREDAQDGRWRGEYFGKQMRGACYAYMYTADEELYEILTWACKELLETQDEYGRISTYTVDSEFFGWDMWCRKYVLTGLLHYYQICKDEKLKEKVLSVCCSHLDCVVDKVGEGKIDIATTSKWWGAVNSSTILEPTIELYKHTNCERYLEFARYIISKGGSSDCNLIELALEGSLMPYQYPVTKAYEIMSFFEGVIAYYEVTGENKYFEAAKQFFQAVIKSDITIIGCSGCTHELFDNSAVRQTEPSGHVMQETCVTVTWIRVMVRMYLLTGDVSYIDQVENSGYNALYGSINTKQCKQWEISLNAYLHGKTFDSYSPLYMNNRGKGIGGFLALDNDEYGGCCVAIGACGVSLIPMTAVVCDEEYLYVNHQFKGTVKVKDIHGTEILLNFDSCYPRNGICKIRVDKECELKLKIRRPGWCKTMWVNGANVTEVNYYDASGHYQSGDEIVFEWDLILQAHYLNGKIAFTYGTIVMAVDSAKTEDDIEAIVSIPEQLSYRLIEPRDEELVRIECDTNNGVLLLTDYQSCGKEWTQEKNKISVWLNTKQ